MFPRVLRPMPHLGLGVVVYGDVAMHQQRATQGMPRRAERG
jgi:hypothetical protein